MNSDYLFVYGTLLKNKDNEMSKFLASHSDFIRKGYFNGKLYLVDWFPGAILSDNTETSSAQVSEERVFGSVFKISDPALVFKVLDDYEGLGEHHPKPHLFKKERITVFLENNTEIKAWVYLYNRSTAHLKRIISGDFIKQ